MRTSKTVPTANKTAAATDAKAHTSPTLAGDAILSPIMEKNMEEGFSTLPEVQGSSETSRLTRDDFMEPLTDLQKDFLTSCIADTQCRLEKENQEERRFYEQHQCHQ
jgi:hypothetical protein